MNKIMQQIIMQKTNMSEFWGMVLFATLIALAATFAVAILYCGFIAACQYCKKRQNEPLSSAENQV
jgi:hypothetical protein